MLTAEWRGKPVYVARRTEESLATLSTLAGRLKDPENTKKEQQPEYADNEYRSRKPESKGTARLTAPTAPTPAVAPISRVRRPLLTPS